MRIISLNANGIRAAARKGFFDWLPKQDADVLCIQETKAKINQLDESFFPPGWHAYYCDANKPGYSGVAIYARQQPDTVHWGLASRNSMPRAARLRRASATCLSSRCICPAALRATIARHPSGAFSICTCRGCAK